MHRNFLNRVFEEVLVPTNRATYSIRKNELIDFASVVESFCLGVCEDEKRSQINAGCCDYNFCENSHRADTPGTCQGSRYVTPSTCFYDTPDACREAALERGLSVGGGGFSFEGSASNVDDEGPSYTEGCYFYPLFAPISLAGNAYFGTGGTIYDMHSLVLPGPYSERLYCRVLEEDDPCFYNTPDACREAALERGLSVGGGGSDFESGSLFYARGCYFYPPDSPSTFAGNAYFGTIGTIGEMQTLSLSAGRKRLYCEEQSCEIEGSAASTTLESCFVNKDESCALLAEALTVATSPWTPQCTAMVSTHHQC